MPVTTVATYLAALPAERRAVVEAVRKVVNDNLPKGYEEGIQHGTIGWYVPKSLYPAGYHANPKLPLPFIHLAAKKAHFALHMMCLYGSRTLNTWFVAEYAKSGKKLDMGKACVRFRRLEDLALDVVGRAVARVPVGKMIAGYEAALGAGAPKTKAARKTKATVKRMAATRGDPSNGSRLSREERSLEEA
jgi:hypothetical protein